MILTIFLTYLILLLFFFFFFNDTATTEIYTLSLHDALPISHGIENLILVKRQIEIVQHLVGFGNRSEKLQYFVREIRSEEHTSELQSQSNLVCRLLLEKKKKNQI